MVQGAWASRTAGCFGGRVFRFYTGADASLVETTLICRRVFGSPNYCVRAVVAGCKRIVELIGLCMQVVSTFERGSHMRGRMPDLASRSKVSTAPPPPRSRLPLKLSTLVSSPQLLAVHARLAGTDVRVVCAAQPPALLPTCAMYLPQLIYYQNTCNVPDGLIYALCGRRQLDVLTTCRRSTQFMSERHSGSACGRLFRVSALRVHHRNVARREPARSRARGELLAA